MSGWPCDAEVPSAASGNGETGLPPLSEIAARIVDRQPHPPLALILLTGVFALTALVVWRSTEWLATMSHEGGHALVGTLMGGRVTGVTIPRRDSGATGLSGLHGMSHVPVAFAGYVGPPLFGMLGAALLDADHTVATLWIAVVLLALLLLLVRNLLAGLAVVMVGGTLLAIAIYAAVVVQTVVSYVLVWFLLMAGIPDLVRLYGLRRGKRGKSGSDVDALRQLTWIPALVWQLIQLVVCGAAFVYGARLLLDI